MSCDLAHLDGSYVLGALAPAERQEFEMHLAHCAACARSVRELAGLPGLLSRVTPAMLTEPVPSDPVPETLLPSLVREVRRTQRRRALVVAGVAAATVVTVVLGALSVGGALDGNGAPTAGGSPSMTSDAGPSPDTPTAENLVPIGHVPVSASLTHEDVGWGTRLALTCTYSSVDEGYSEPHWESYSMFVRTRDGRVEQVASWLALPGRTMTLDAATASRWGDIASVEVRTADGQAVLKLTS
ncbi:MAG: anti-sigma factor family protein [Nocardioides sp.]